VLLAKNLFQRFDFLTEYVCLSLHTKFAAFARLAEWHFLRATGIDDDDDDNNNNNNNKFRKLRDTSQ
jgi:hypothetical protein